MIEHNYSPDYAAAPGDILEEILETREISKGDLAERCGLSPKTISLITAGKAPVTSETAIQFERVLGMSANVWNNLEANYRLFRAKKQDFDELEKHEDWLNKFPVKEMVRRCWMAPGSNLAENVALLLNYFGVGSVAAWEEKYGNLRVRLRKAATYQPSREALAAWVRRGEIKAAAIDTKPYNKEKMGKALDEIRGLSCEDPDYFESKMVDLMASAGVALVFINELPSTHLSGATKWLSANKAMMALSLRYKTDDHLWFTFFHEAAHLKLHSKKLAFIDGTDRETQDQQEEEADQFATNHLIPQRIYNRFTGKDIFTAASIRELAGELGIAPGIIVGRLQHDKYLDWGKLNYLKCRFQLVE